MSKGASRLSLGALPRAESMKLTITVPVELKAQLEAYAEVHSRLHGPVDAVALIPHMLAAFIARDRGFRVLANKGAALGHKSRPLIDCASNTSNE